MVRQIQDYIYGGPQQSLEERQRCSVTMDARMLLVAFLTFMTYVMYHAQRNWWFKHGGHPQNPEIRIFPWRKFEVLDNYLKTATVLWKTTGWIDGLVFLPFFQFTIFWKDQFFGCCLLHDRVRWLFRHQAWSNVHGVHVRLCHWPVYLWSLCGPGKAQTGIDLGHVAGQIGLCQTSFLIIFTKWWYPDFSAIFHLRVETSPGCVVHCCQFWKASWVRMAVAAKDSATSCGSWCASSKASCKRQDGRVRWPSWGTGFHRRGTMRDVVDPVSSNMASWC